MPDTNNTTTGSANVDGGFITTGSPTNETITVQGYPTCGCCGGKNPYEPVTRTFYNYCPNCKKTGTLIAGELGNSIKGIPDGEITCGNTGPAVKSKGNIQGCDADYCGFCGGDKAGGGKCETVKLIMAGAGANMATEEGGATYVRIPDKTFTGIINQICGATDSVFVVANNCCYLLQYQDFYKYVDKFKDKLTTIESDEISRDNIAESQPNAGFYNTVAIKDTGIKIGYKELVDLYGEQIYEYEKPTDTDENDEIEKLSDEALAKALLAQHTRDYGAGLKANVLYNSGVNPGSFINIENRLKYTKQNNISTVQNNVNQIESTKTNADGSKETTLKNVEQYFVQGYTLRWDQSTTLSMDLDLKYGPDTPDDPINATITTGGGGTASNGPLANSSYTDCDTSHDLSGEGPYTVPHRGDIPTNIPEEFWLNIGRTGTNYDIGTRGCTDPLQIYRRIKELGAHYAKVAYADNHQDCADESWDVMTGYGLNCGDFARLFKACCGVRGIRCIVVHVHLHYYNAAPFKGTIHTFDLCNTQTLTNSWHNTGEPVI